MYTCVCVCVCVCVCSCLCVCLFRIIFFQYHVNVRELLNTNTMLEKMSRGTISPIEIYHE